MNAIRTDAKQLLDIVSGHVESVVPGYDRPQADVMVALDSGTGNCLAKSVIAAVVTDHITGVEGTSALFYHKMVHPSEYSDMFGKVHLGFGHAAMLAQTDSGIWTLGFNLNNTKADDRYVVEANDEGEERFEVNQDGVITAVAEYSKELVVGDWYDVYRQYMEAVNIPDSSAHAFELETLRGMILDRMINPNRPRPTDRSLSAA